MVRRRRIPALAALVAMVVALALATAAPASAATGLDDVLRSVAAREHVPQVEAALVRDGRVLWSGTAGGVQPGDRFVLASATKMVVATLVARLADQGRLSLDDPVQRWVPGVPNGARITLAMLLSHRSGLREYFASSVVERALEDPSHAWTSEELLAVIRGQRPEREPDTRYAYRNTNYLLLGAVVERVTGEELEAVLRREVSDPLRLGALSFERGAPAAGRLVTGHELEGRRVVDVSDAGRVPNDAIGAVWSDGGLASTARDLALFTDALLGGRLLAPATLARMTRTGRAGYGLGISAVRAPGVGTVLGHDGLYGGYTSYAFRSPRTATTLVVLANLDAPNDPAWTIADALWRAQPRP